MATGGGGGVSLRFGSSALSAARARDAALSSRGGGVSETPARTARVHQGRRPLVALALDHLRRRVLGGQRLRGAPEHRGRLPHQRVDAVFLHRYRFYGVRRLLGAAALRRPASQMAEGSRRRPRAAAARSPWFWWFRVPAAPCPGGVRCAPKSPRAVSSLRGPRCSVFTP